MTQLFEGRLKALEKKYNNLVSRKNEKIEPGNGIFSRYRYPVMTAEHAPVDWKYDMDPETNPFMMERLGINAVFNAGAIKKDGRYLMMCRVEGADRKSFFALAESGNGIDGWEFRGKPLDVGQSGNPDTNVYDMRLTEHEDGYIYGIFCTERKDPDALPGDTVSAIADAGIVRTKDMENWERLPDLKSSSSQQRNVILHPEFVDGKYMLYTRPQDGFIETGSGGGICWGISESMNPAIVSDEKIMDPKAYHTIKEVKNGGGAPPLRTDDGWLHVVHGVRNTAAGLRYVVYAFMTALEKPWEVTARPGGYLIAPDGDERIGDVSNVVFCNGAIVDDDGRLLIYYASSDTRMHVAESSLAQMVDYCMKTPEDRGSSGDSVRDRLDLIHRNWSQKN